MACAGRFGAHQCVDVWGHMNGGPEGMRGSLYEFRTWILPGQARSESKHFEHVSGIVTTVKHVFVVRACSSRKQTRCTVRYLG